LKARAGDELHAETEWLREELPMRETKPARGASVFAMGWFALSKHLMRYAALPE
jgi:hypothetical protein